MIPHHIKLSGFLSYRDEQAISFNGSQLWMLSGLNGSGKSTVFDAVTYALFGHHRGGQSQAVELINKDSKGLAVEFDFRIDKELFRIKRTLKRTPKGTASGTQQIYEWRRDPFGDGGDWAPIPDTTRKAEFDSWVREKIGLNYETFTSSVLLLQGKAEKLLDSQPKGRAEVLAGIVDLERYQRLHERADNCRRALKAQLEAVQSQFENVPEVTDLELAVAQGKADEATEAQQAAVLAVEHLQALEYEARQWVELRKRLAALGERQKQAETLLEEGPHIEKDFRRLRELQEVLPHIQTIQERERSIAMSQDTTKRLEAEREAIRQKQESLEHAFGLGRQKRLSLQKTIAADEQTLKRTEGQLRELAALLEKVRQLERQQTETSSLEAELARLPAEPDKDVRRLQAGHDQRVEFAQVLPVLERFQQGRTDLNAARQRTEKDEARAASIMQAGKQAGEQSKALREQADAAITARVQADDRATKARTLLEQATADLTELHSLEGKKACRHCGQPLTAAHLQQESKRREEAAAAAERRCQEAASARQKALQDEKALTEAAALREKENRELQDDYRECSRDVKEARKEADRAAQECRQAYLSLPETFRLKIAPGLCDDWLKTEYPSRGDLSALRKDAGELDAVRRQLRAAQAQLNTWTGMQARLSAAREALARLKAELHGTDPATLHERNASLRGEEESLAGALKGSKKSLQETEAEIDRVTKDLSSLAARVGDLNAKLQTEDVSRQHWRDTLERARHALPPSWQSVAARAGLAEQLQWKHERDELLARAVEKRHEQLASARISVEDLKRELVEAQQQEARFPEEARQAPEKVAALKHQAKARAGECDRALKEADKAKAMLDQNRRRREELRAQTLDLEREHNYGALLAQLLGRERLQRHLVRVAERQIVDYANGMLDRLSGGQLFLRLVGGEDGLATERALDLEACNRTTKGSAINVAFLSGSQRFRVAVSLALGIGQYASRQHRPIESVIIDEGFGCLDRQGRQVMIQELQNLRGHLHCILLVSHQEEFADAFPDGYRFALDDGATKVTRLQR